MAKAFLDTTVLTDLLLKADPAKAAAEAAIKRFDATQLPVYAIKEFKRGPFKNFVWMYNKLSLTGSFSRAIAALHAMSRTPRRYTTSTALEALIKASSSIADAPLASLVAKYGPDATHDSVLCDELRLALKKTIYQAWDRRRSVTDEVVFPLSCYNEVGPFEVRNLIEIDPIKCDRESTCCLTPILKTLSDDLRKMKQAIDGSKSERAEERRRAQALRHAYRDKDDLTDEQCRNLGDAVFVALAPKDSIILTTNMRDFALLANAVGKKIESVSNIVKSQNVDKSE